MKTKLLVIAALGAMSLAGCAKKEEVAVAPPPPGAVNGTVAADRDGDGVVDGYYDSSGMYHANYAPPPPPPPPPTRTGEKG